MCEGKKKGEKVKVSKSFIGPLITLVIYSPSLLLQLKVWYRHGNTCIAHQEKKRCRKRRNEVSDTPPQTNTQMHNTHTHKRAGHQTPSLENWDGGLKIFHGVYTM